MQVAKTFQPIELQLMLLAYCRALSAATEQAARIPDATLNTGHKIPLLGLGTAGQAYAPLYRWKLTPQLRSGLTSCFAGTWRTNPDSAAASAVETAIKAGYRYYALQILLRVVRLTLARSRRRHCLNTILPRRHIDGAKVYENEEGVGK